MSGAPDSAGMKVHIVTYHTVSRRLSQYLVGVTRIVMYTSADVPVSIDGKLVFSIGEALREAAISRATFFRWVKDGVIHDTEFRDRNGRRVFTADEVDDLKRFAHKLVAAPQLRIPLPRPR